MTIDSVLFSEREDVVIPRSILSHKDAYLQLFDPSGTPTKSSTAVSVFERAAQYKQGATAVRIGNTVRTGGSAGVNQNLERASAAREVVRERQEKKDAYNTRADSVIIHTYVYMWPLADFKQNQKKKMMKVSDVILMLYSI